MGKFQQWNEKVLKLQKSNYKLRLGQVYMNALAETDFELYESITGTDRDCFYDNSKAYPLMDYLAYVYENANKWRG